LPDEDDDGKRTVPLLGLNERGQYRRRSKVTKAVLLEFRRTSLPLAPYELAGLLIERGVYKGRRKRNLVTHMKNLLRALASRSVLESAGVVPAKISGTQEAYRLTAYGRMIAWILLLDESERPTRKEARRAILDFMTEYCKTGNMFTDFDFDVMIEMLGTEDLGVLTEFFQFGMIYRNFDTLRRPTPGWIRYLGEMWTSYLNFPGYPGYAKAFLTVFSLLPEDKKRAIAMYVKTRLERDWLLGIPPEKRYICAVAKGGELVHLPMLCPKCGEIIVVEKGVEKMYRDVSRSLRAKCPRCGSVLRMPKWVPWYFEGMGMV